MKHLKTIGLSKIAVVLLIAFGIAISCKKEIEKDDNHKLNSRDYASIQDTLLPDTSFPGFYTFINQAVSSDGIQNNYKVSDALSFGESFANYLYTENDTFGIPIDTLRDSTQFTISLYSQNSINYISNSNINSLLSSLNSYYTNKATSLGFKENPNLHFKFMDFIWNEADISNNTLTFSVIVDVCVITAMPPGCQVHDAFPNIGLRAPSSNDGQCYNSTDNYTEINSEVWAFYEIHTRLNTPGLCNNDLGCTKTFTLPAPSTQFPTVYKWVSMKYGIELQTADNYPFFNPNLWNGLAPDGMNPYVCETAAKIESDYYHVLNASISQKPNYTIPNTSITTIKDIMSYNYSYSPNDFGNTDIPDNYWGQFASFKYAVCVNVPIEQVGSNLKNYKDWRGAL